MYVTFRRLVSFPGIRSTVYCYSGLVPGSVNILTETLKLLHSKHT